MLAKLLIVKTILMQKWDSFGKSLYDDTINDIIIIIIV
jgi:hypothetical protein